MNEQPIPSQQTVADLDRYRANLQGEFDAIQLYRAMQFTPAQEHLSNEMVRYWGAFARTGAPKVRGQAAWPTYRSDRMLSLRPGGRSLLITSARYEAQHHCDFWRPLSGAASSRGAVWAERLPPR